MAKYFIILVIVGFIGSFCGLSFAAAVSGANPITDNSLVAFALEYDYIFDRDLKSSDISKGKIDEQNTFYGKLTFKATDFIIIYGKAGIAKFNTKLSLNNGNALNEKYNMGFYTGIGAKIIYEFIPKVKVAVDNQINWWRSDVDEVSYAGISASTLSGHASAWEYQLAGILSYTIDNEKLIHPAQGEWPEFTPYAGIKFAYLEMDSKVTASTPSASIPMPDSFNNDNKFGVIVGLDVNFVSLGGFSMNIEGRFLDENAISGFLNYNF